YAEDENKVCERIVTPRQPALAAWQTAGQVLSGRSPSGAEPQTGGRTLQQHLATKTHEPRWPAASRRADLAGFLDKTLLLDQPAEILLVHSDAGERLDGPLQLQQREGRRHQLENHRPVFDLAAEAAERRGQDAAMVKRHRDAGAEDVTSGNRAGHPPSDIAHRL